MPLVLVGHWNGQRGLDSTVGALESATVGHPNGQRRRLTSPLAIGMANGDCGLTAVGHPSGQRRPGNCSRWPLGWPTPLESG